MDGRAPTMAFSTLTMLQMFHVPAVRLERDPPRVIGLPSNRQRVGAVMLTLARQLAVLAVPGGVAA